MYVQILDCRNVMRKLKNIFIANMSDALLVHLKENNINL